MMIGGVNGGSKPHMPKQLENGGGDIATLERQREAIQKEIQRVQGDNKLAPDAKKQRLEALQKKIQEIDNAIQKASSKETTGSDSASASVERAASSALSNSSELKNTLESSNAEMETAREEKQKNRMGEVGNLLDLYV